MSDVSGYIKNILTNNLLRFQKNEQDTNPLKRSALVSLHATWLQTTETFIDGAYPISQRDELINLRTGVTNPFR